MTRPISIALLAAFSCVVLAGTATAQIDFAGPLDPGQEVPPVTTSTASGNGCYTLNADSTLSYNISYSGLSSAETMAHFHGPANPGQNAPPVITLATGSPKVGTTAPLTATQYNDVVAGMWYVNVHTQTNTNGEIRGQILQGTCNPVSVEDHTWGGVKALYR